MRSHKCRGVRGITARKTTLKGSQHVACEVRGSRPWFHQICPLTCDSRVDMGRSAPSGAMQRLLRGACRFLVPRCTPESLQGRPKIEETRSIEPAAPTGAVATGVARLPSADPEPQGEMPGEAQVAVAQRQAELAQRWILATHHSLWPKIFPKGPNVDRRVLAARRARAKRAAESRRRNQVFARSR